MAMQAAKLGTVAIWTLAIAATASAADMRMPLKAPPPPPVFNWSGCYLGGYVGGAFNTKDVVFTDLGNTNFRAYSGGITAGRVEDRHSWDLESDNGFFAGGTLGCNWQPVGSPFVLGIEGEGGYLKVEGSSFDPSISPTISVAALRATTDVLGSAKVGDWYAMITGRLGYAWDRWLLYVKGGAAFLPVHASVTDACLTAGCGNWIISTTSKDTVTAWTAGGGAEWAFAYNWSIKAEYMFIGLSETVTTCGSATVASGATVGGGPFCFNHDFGGIHTAKVGLNYRFGASGAPY